MGGKSLAGPAKSITKHMAGIISYGVYIPCFRIKTAEIAYFQGRTENEVGKGLGITEKAIAGIDEDTVTMATEAALRAIDSGCIKKEEIEALAIGSESHPYIVKPSSTIVANFLGLSDNLLAVDTEFACKAATSAMAYTSGLIKSRQIKAGIVIGSDTAQAKIGDALEFSAGSAAACFILGKGKIIARMVDFTSYSSDTPDFWRRDGEKFPSHAGRFSGEPSYFAHITHATKRILEKNKMKPSDFDYAVFHMPNGKFPKEIAKRMGFSWEQIQQGFFVEKIGNPYSASCLVGLAAVLDIARSNQKIFICSYGSGAGSDAFIFETTDEIKNFQKNNGWRVRDQIEEKIYLSYQDLIKIMMAKGYL